MHKLSIDKINQLTNDKYRPMYHFTSPATNCHPGDANGAFFVDGVYHLMFLYQTDDDSYAWGHISSTDLLHWDSRPDAIGAIYGDKDGGCYSGGAFVDEDKTAYLTYWRIDKGFDKDDDIKYNPTYDAVEIATSTPPYDDWQILTRITKNTQHGVSISIDTQSNTRYLASSDPSNIWKDGDTYYVQMGNKPLLDKLGAVDEYYTGGYTDLYKSTDMLNWHYVGRFVSFDHSKNWTDKSEDIMCPTILPIPNKRSGGEWTGKYLNTYISHNRGAQYMIGSIENETFVPSIHGRFSYEDAFYFAPEALVDDKNRHILWAWLRWCLDDDYNRYGWSGVYSFPRELWLEGDNLKMSPALELDNLEHSHIHLENIAINDRYDLKPPNDEFFRIKLKVTNNTCDYIEIILKNDEELGEYTSVKVDVEKKTLEIDERNSGSQKLMWDIPLIKEVAPLDISKSDDIYIDLFVDRSVVEVYVNNSQALCRRVYPTRPDLATTTYLKSNGAICDLTICAISTTNEY